MTLSPAPYADQSLREVAVGVTTVWTSPEAPRDLDAAAVRDLPDPHLWADSMDSDVRLGLHGRTETQLLMGEPVLVLEERGAWSRIVALWQPSSRDERGYPGWVISAHLGAAVPGRQGSSATVVVTGADCLVEATTVELSFATRLAVESLSAQTATLLLPGDRRGTVALDGLRLDETGEAPTSHPDQVLAAARQFLGLPYLWGGTSAWGMDCSGIVHLAFRSLGVQVPRDAHDQAAAMRDVPLDAVRPGDLYFFAPPGDEITHVGYVTRPVAADGTRWMLHAPETGKVLEESPFAPHRFAHLVSAGRVPTS